MGGANVEELFSRAAEAMFDIIAEIKSPGLSVINSPFKNQIRLKADSIEELLINWLNELLSLSATKELVFSDFKIQIQNNNLEAEAVAKEMKNYRVKSEIKAATYHQLKIIKIAEGWQAEVIFDV